MSLQISSQGSKPKSEIKQREIAKKGPRVGIISGIIDLGIQPQEYQSEKQRDCREFLPIITLCQDKYTDEDGNERNMVTSPWPVKIKLGEKANYVKFCAAADPNGEVVPDGIGDISGLIGRPVFAVMAHNQGKGEYADITYANCKGIQELPEDYPVPETDYNAIVFDSANPDKEVFDKLYERTQNLITSAVDWKGFKVVQDSPATPHVPDQGFEDILDDIPF